MKLRAVATGAVKRKRAMHRRLRSVSSSHQLALSLPGGDEPAMRAAHRRAHLAMPFEVALHHPALAICLRCCAEAHERRRR